VCTWQGFAYVAFVTDVFSKRILGWNVAATLNADIRPLQALDMAAFDADANLTRLTGLTHQSDHRSNYMAMVYTDRIAELGAVPSTTTIGDSHGNTMTQAVNALHKTVLIRARGPSRTVEPVELATLEWVWWWNNQHLHPERNDRSRTRVLR
jgi:putative transposase